MVEKVNIELLLVRKLAEDYLKSKITDLIELTGDASSRKYYRFLHSGKSYVACLASPFQSERDSDFYVIQKLMDSSGIKVPQIFSLKPNEGFYLEEDLGDSTLVSYLGSDVDKNVSIEKYKSILDTKDNAFFSVNAVARKPEKCDPETNPYLIKFMKQSAWQPKKLGVFAGKIDYPKYKFFDKHIIRFIMWITNGPTDINESFEFTDWSKVDDFAKDIFH